MADALKPENEALDSAPEFAEERRFVDSFLAQVPELKPAWDEYVEESYEFLPVGVMYDLARGMVDLAEEALHAPKSGAASALDRAFDYLEKGMQEREEGPIPNLIRTTMCDWLGRQSLHPERFDILLGAMGPLVKRWLTLADDRMPFRHNPNAKLSLSSTSRTKVAQGSDDVAPTSHPVVHGSELLWVMGQAWRYSLYRYHDAYLLSVVCGGVGLDAIDMLLRPKEHEAYDREGRAAVEAIVDAVNLNPKAFSGRRVEVIDGDRTR